MLWLSFYRTNTQTKSRVSLQLQVRPSNSDCLNMFDSINLVLVHDPASLFLMHRECEYLVIRDLNVTHSSGFAT